jgi:two-component system chemotaxis response regulator CheB
MIGRNIVVIGASAGGVDALSRIVEDLPADLNASVFIVLHIGAAHSRLPEILARKSRLPVSQPEDGETIRVGRVYVAPPDRHMMLERGRIRLTHGPKENFTRPAIDPLFRSAAIEFGPRVVGIVLTGHLDDGSAGLIAIKDRGGVAVVQDPSEAYAPGMPQSAIDCVAVDHCCSVVEMAKLVQRYDPPDMVLPPVPKQMIAEHRLSAMEAFLSESRELERLGSPSSFSCPECGGVLFQLHDDRLLRFRCRTGHALSARALSYHLSRAREAAIWSAVRLLEDETSLIRILSTRATGETPDLKVADTAQAIVLIELSQMLYAAMNKRPGTESAAAPPGAPVA